MRQPKKAFEVILRESRGSEHLSSCVGNSSKVGQGLARMTVWLGER